MAVSKFGEEIKGGQNIKGERKSLNIKKCVVNKRLLINDIGSNKSAMGGILVYTNLREVGLKNVRKNPNFKGKEVYRKLCKRNDMNYEFRRKFCDGNELKRNLRKSERNDIKHVGSAILLKEKVIITNNLKDIKPIEKVTNIKVI